MKKLLFLLLSPLAIMGYSQSIPADSLYLGQTPPGNSSVVFAPGIISKTASYEHDIAFSPDGKEMFYCISQTNWSNFQIYRAYWSLDHWTKPALADFSTQYKNTEICYSPDGQSLLFASNRAPGGDQWNFAIIKLTKINNQWSTPTEIGIKKLQPAANDGNWHPSITNDSIVYFSSYASDSYDIYYAKLKNGVASNFLKMGNDINSSTNDWYPWIAPDNSYLLFSSERSGGFGGSDLYISFRKTNNTWTSPKNLGNSVNTAGNESSPRVSPDGKYLFFTRTINWDGDFYWLKAGIVDVLKKQVFAPKLSKQIPDINAKTDAAINYVIPSNTFTCEYGSDALQYTATLKNDAALPSWLKFDATTRTLSGTPKQAAVDSIKITVTNKDNVAATCTFKIEVSTQIGVENTLESKIKIFPNPSTRIFTIEIDDVSSKNARVEIYNTDGKLVFSKEIGNGIIDLTGYSKGIYMLKVKSSQGSTNHKLVKQ